ncbi:MAG: glycosyltransferase family 4 protein [Bacteroidales bacterium]|nr:glycosyltransferase family 4 protein [Bacteroidales bacterium]
MRILQIHNKVPYPPKDGGSIAVFNLSEGFAKFGNKVDILALNTKKHSVNLLKIQNKLPKNINIYAVDIDTDIKLLKALKNLLFSSLPYNAERFINNNFKTKLKEILKENTYDIVQIEGLYMMPYIEIIKENSNSCVSYRAHNIEHEIWEKTYLQEENLLKKIYLKNLYKRIKKFETSYINKYELLIPITKRDAEHFNLLGNTRKIHVSPTGVDSNKYKIKEQNFDAAKLFHLGSLDWIPNQEGLIWFLENIWNKIIEKNKEIIFTIAGRNSPDYLIEKFNTYKNVNYIGEIEDALKFIHSQTTMIVPLLSGSGMRIKIIEGMAAGKVILTTSKGAEGISGKNGRDFLIADSAKEFIEQIIKIYKNNNLIQEISSNAQSFISDNFDNFTISKTLIEFYETMIE